jgi:hypothetical protein
MARGVALTIVLSFVLGVAFAVAFVVTDRETVGAVFLVTVVVVSLTGGSRLLLYPVEWLLARLRRPGGRDPFLALSRHPALWDELTMWPLPGLDSPLQRCLDRDLDRGLGLAMRIAMSPFQRSAVQRVLSDYVGGRPDALALVYHLAHLPMLDEYLVPPSRRFQYKSYRSARLVLMAELGQRYLAASSEATQNTEYLVWRFTRRGWLRPRSRSSAPSCTNCCEQKTIWRPQLRRR